MNKTLIRALLASGCAFAALAPAAGHAQSGDIEARLARMEAEIASLRAELAAEKARNASVATTVERISAAPAPAPAAAPAPAPADGFRVGATTVKLNGFIKAEALYSDFEDGDPASGALERDFYVPGAIPVGGRSEGAKFDSHIKQTRLWFTTSTPVGDKKLNGHVEFDFQSASGTQGDDRVTNAYNFAVRRAFFTYGRWSFGQDWSTFQNTAVLPETTDFIGATDGTVFVRQPQIRYTLPSGWAFAIENPETTVSTFGTSARLVADDSGLPDAVLRYNGKTASGGVEYSVAGILRPLSYEGPGGVIGTRTIAVDDDALGWGVTAAAKFKVGKTDDIRLMVTGGEGIGRYVALNFTNDARVTARGELEPIPLVAAFVNYRHFWTERTRSTFGVNTISVDVDRATMGAGASKSATSWYANLFWSPAKGFDVGVEFRHANRELESGLEGALNRIHFVAKQTF